jgi:hypothetical protein
LKNHIYLSLITIAVIIVGLSLISKAYAFTLDVTVTNKHFGDRSAYVEVKGPDGYTTSHTYNWASIKTGVTSGMVTLNLPDDAFPIGGTYEVCVSSKPLYSLIFPYCYQFGHENEEEAVTTPLN